jgi:hypothetical protein
MTTDIDPATNSETEPSSAGSPVEKSAVEFSTLEVDHDRWLESKRHAPEAVLYGGEEKIFAEQHDLPIVDEAATEPPLPQYSKAQSRFGRNSKTLWIISAILLFLILAAAIGGGVGGSLSAKKHHNNGSTSISSPTPSPTNSPPNTRPIYQNSGLAAMQWVDLNNTNHYRVYYQDASNAIMESAWDSNGTTWQVSQVSDPAFQVKPGTPIAAAAGYPHANYSYTLVCSSSIFRRHLS